MGTDKNKNIVLVVDDQQENLDLLTRILEEEYIVLQASNGANAVEMAKERLPDVILLDAVMPGVSGPEVMDELKSFAETEEIPVIILLEMDMVEDDDDGFLLGAVDYIQKPLPTIVVKSRVRNHMRIVNQKRMLDQLYDIDSLTGVFGKKFFETRMDQEWRRAMRDGTQLSMLTVAIDDFASYDTKKGNEILKTVSAITKSNLKRPMDILARWENEIFLALLPNTYAYGAAVLAEIIRKSIEEAKIPSNDGSSVTASIGVNWVYPEKHSSSAKFVPDALETFDHARRTRKNMVFADQREP